MKIVKNLFMILMFGGTLLASDARIAALGGNAGFWADDDQNYTLFPQAINNLDYIQVSGAGAGNGNVGVVWGEGTTWGFMFDGADDTEGNDWLNIAWGNGNMGVLFGLGMSADDNGLSGDDNVSTSTMNIDVGWGQDMDFGEVGVFFSTGSSDDGDSETDEPATMGLAANIRRTQSLWLFSDMLVGFGYGSWTLGDASNTGMALSVDCFTKLAMAEGVNAVFSMGFGYQSLDEDDGTDVVSSSEIALPNATIGVEAGVTDWATVRFGMNHSYILTGAAGDATYSGAGDFGWNFGLGFDYGSFTLDMVLEDEGIFNNPVHYVTGRNEAPLATSATLTYSF